MYASNEVRVFVKQFDNTIRNTNDSANLKIICADIEKLIKYENETELKCFSFSNYSESRACFIRNFYMSVLKSALNNISTDTPKHLSVHALSAFLQFLFLNGNYKDSLLTLAWGINEFRPSYRLNKCVSLLEEFLSSHVLCKIFKQQCSVTSQAEQTYVWDELINAITSLPDKTANKLQSQNSELFYPKCYITLVTKDIITVLEDMVTSVKANKDIHLEFISRLIGKLCITGYADMLMEVMVGSLAPVLKEDFIWCRICERIITGVPDRCLESVLLSMIDKLPWYGLMDKFLGDSILKKQKIQYLLCTKVLLFRHSEKIHILQNVLGYLGTSHTRRHLLIKSFKELLSVWGDNSAIRHTSPEQHLYLTRALFISLGFLTEKDKENHKDELIRLIMPGVQAHIGNSEHKIRKQGMVLAETLASVIDPNGPKLKFEYEKDKETVALLDLMIPPSDPGLEQLQKKFEAIQLEQKAETKMMDTDHKTAKQMETRTNVDSDLDSDDDLVPYDMSNDVKVTQVKEPKYIRDCMEGLISNDEPERTEICLKCAEGLIRKHPDGLEEIATEFTKVLLHLGDKYAIPGYTQQRFKAMVSLTVCVPIQVADYLTAEFYDRNYNLRQRMDILEVLASAAQELSQPAEQPVINTSDKKIVEVEEDTWQSIVQKRIESKTRKFSKGKSKPELQKTMNRFAPVAGHFFYPLMTRFDRKENTFDMLGEDSLVLGRLIYTLGVVMYSAINSPTVKQMATVLLEFLWILRFHQDQSVRHSILFCLSMVMLSVPGHVLLSQLQSEIMEAKQWLEDVVQKDPDTESKRLALQCLVLLENTIKQEFTGEEPA
ncbi:telomere length regulation protein TEL2 homolog isoform X1 [Mytilus californianus]|uniref:telomere length regulation protein TEL2 homolog isoform X1 n=1 Tax=Mytilus californianus TaxID=6549 RepID=UPI0022459950|nr:telomere length regulation protein TEL2 homolog isoform X1 [Mytilus californianus]